MVRDDIPLDTMSYVNHHRERHFMEIIKIWDERGIEPATPLVSSQQYYPLDHSALQANT